MRSRQIEKETSEFPAGAIPLRCLTWAHQKITDGIRTRLKNAPWRMVAHQEAPRNLAFCSEEEWHCNIDLGEEHIHVRRYTPYGSWEISDAGERYYRRSIRWETGDFRTFKAFDLADGSLPSELADLWMGGLRILQFLRDNGEVELWGRYGSFKGMPDRIPKDAWTMPSRIVDGAGGLDVPAGRLTNGNEVWVSVHVVINRAGQFDEPDYASVMGKPRKGGHGSPSMYDYMVASPGRAYTAKELKAWMKQHGMTETTYRSDRAAARKMLSIHHPEISVLYEKFDWRTKHRLKDGTTG